MVTVINRTSKLHCKTLSPPGDQYYALLRQATWTLRQRGTEPDLLEFLDSEIEKIQMREGVVA